VTAVFPGTNPLERVLGAQIGVPIGAIHRSKGVRLLAGPAVAAFEGTERVTAVVTEDGNRIACDLAVVGVGIVPDVSAVAGSSVTQQNGILVDEKCRTSAVDVFSAGDVANHLHPVLGRIRVEHYNSAGHHGAAAARSMLGSAVPFDYIHNFWSDQYEHTLQYVGHATRWDEFAVRGNLEEGKAAAIGLYLDGGVVRAAVGFDRGGDPDGNPTLRWPPARSSWLSAPSPIATCSPTRTRTCGRWPADTPPSDPRGGCGIRCSCRRR
jgi:3-phenylpropionate/trans-cinnamate dioxygenase ferredoxin reductase component